MHAENVRNQFSDTKDCIKLFIALKNIFTFLNHEHYYKYTY